MTALDVRCASSAGLLTLLGLRGVGPYAAERLAARFEVLGQVREAARTDLKGLLSTEAESSVRDARAWEQSYGHAVSVLEKAERLGVRILTIADDEYPANLRPIPDPPLLLYVKGRLRPDRRAVACVGTREPSRFGVEVTQRIVSFLASHGWSVVSGLAIGVDALAHQEALEVGAHTVAVLANGLDTVYPRTNRGLAEAILAAGGAWVSEQTFGTPAVPRNLVQRDRLQSGMSVGTVVMQTDLVGGSMHTVRYTLLQERLLFAPVPSGAHAAEPKSRGILALTQRTGSEFGSLVTAEGEYAELLRDRFATRPVAAPITSRDDYATLLSMLDAAVASPPAVRARARQPQPSLL